MGEHKKINYCLKQLREQLKELTNQYEKSENDLKALQSVGQVGNGVWGIRSDGNLFFSYWQKVMPFSSPLQIVGEVLKQLTEEKCKWIGLLINKEKKSRLPFLPP